MKPAQQLICGIALLASVCLPPVAAANNGFRLDDPLVPAEEIFAGGPPRDGIPSIDNPTFVNAAQADFLSAKDRVLGINLNGITRAYPVRIMNYHEIVNDRFGDQAIAVTFCPLCGTGMAFASNIAARTLEFGVSGLLYNNDMLMYDRQTGSLWSQLSMLAINGPLKGTTLAQIALSHTSWADWRERHPATEVLSYDTGHERNYRVNPYPNYGRDRKLYFPVKESNRAYKRKELTLGLEIEQKFRAYPFTELNKGPLRFTDEFQGTTFDVIYDQDAQTARILDTEGQEIPTTLAFWFAWYAFHPDTEIYTAN